jgi:pimeloyl-ACP methyl ester carboxylesterase
MDHKIEVRPGRTLHVVVDKNPESDTTIFLIHGLGGRGNQWRKQSIILKSQYSLVIPDLLGHGKSDKPKPGKTNPYAFLEFCQDLQVLLDKFADKKNILIGHSYGGALAVYLSYTNQDILSSQVLLTPSRCQPFHDVPKIYRLPAFILALLRPFLEYSFRKYAFDKSTKNKVIDEELSAGKKNRFYVIKAMLEGMQDIPRINISGLNTPTLIITGEADHIIPTDLITKFYEKLPHHEFVHLHHAGHMVQLEQPDVVNELIMGFIDKYEMST